MVSMVCLYIAWCCSGIFLGATVVTLLGRAVVVFVFGATGGTAAWCCKWYFLGATVVSPL